MKAVFVIDIDDEDELGEAFATITSEEKDYYFFTKGVIRLLPHKKMPKQGEAFPQDMRLIDRWRGWDACIDEIMGETNG